jgi:type II secretory pathway component HofQ
LSLTNVTSSIIQASVQLQDTVASTTAYFVQNVTIPPNVSVRLINGGERLVVGPSTNILLWSNNPSSIDVVLSWVEIS